MRLEPVFVAPARPAASMSSRRAFLGMGITFAFGGAIGSACGYSVGLASAGPGKPDEAGDLEPTGDADLDEFRRLAVKAPIEELMASSLQLLQGVSLTYRTDRLLWQGVDRICTDLVKRHDPKDRLVARLITQIIAQAEQPFASEFAHWSPKLLEIK